MIYTEMNLIHTRIKFTSKALYKSMFASRKAREAEAAEAEDEGNLERKMFFWDPKIWLEFLRTWETWDLECGTISASSFSKQKES